MLKGNKGEWSELYAFCYLLHSGVLITADKNLKPTENIYFPILKILREEKSGIVLKYYPSDPNNQTIKIFNGNKLLGKYKKQEFKKTIETLYKEIPKGKKAFEIPDVNRFFDGIYVSRLKADSLRKQDIDIQIHDIHTGINPICGFSIKSYLGASPTLVNPGKSTNFIYNIENCTNEIMNNVNAINTRTKIIDKIQYLKGNQCKINSSNEMVSTQFNENLEFVDSKMPLIISQALLLSYQTGTKTVSDIINLLQKQNPLNYSNGKMYTYKFKKFLCACALGMTPEKNWEGTEDANGGYIVVKRDGSVVCYHIYNRTDFEQYLYDYTCFDTPSTSRYEYMSVYKENGMYKLKLNLQIRFI